MSDIGKRVKGLREAKGLTQQRLATAANVSIAYVRQLEQGIRATAPSVRHLGLLATALGTTVADLTGEVVPAAGGVLSLPLVGVVAAGDGEDDVYDAGTMLPVHTLYPSGTVAYRVRGDSMVDALIADGDYILVRLQPTALPGEVVVVWVPDCGTVVKLKRKKHYASANDAKPRNPIPVHGCREYGVLVGVIRKC